MSGKGSKRKYAMIAAKRKSYAKKVRTQANYSKLALTAVSKGVGSSKRVWLTYSVTINDTQGNPGFKNYQFMGNDVYRPDPLNAVSPPGYASLGAIYGHWKVVMSTISATMYNYDGSNAVAVVTTPLDNATVPTIGTVTATGYTMPAFCLTNSGKSVVVPNNTAGLASIYNRATTTRVIKAAGEESIQGTTAAGGGNASPTSLWYWNFTMQPLTPGQLKLIAFIKIRYLVEFHDPITA